MARLLGWVGLRGSVVAWLSGTWHPAVALSESTYVCNMDIG